MSEKTVYGKLFKSEQVDLSSEKVELASLKEQLLGATKGVNTFGKNIDISIDEITKAKRALGVDLSDLKSDLGKLENAVERISKQTKELGINPNDVTGFKEATEALKYADKQIKIAEKELK